MIAIKRSRTVLIVVAAAVLLLGLLGMLGAAALFGADDAPAKKPATGRPAEPRQAPNPAELDEDAFAPVGEVGADQ